MKKVFTIILLSFIVTLTGCFNLGKGMPKLNKKDEILFDSAKYDMYMEILSDFSEIYKLEYDATYNYKSNYLESESNIKLKVKGYHILTQSIEIYDMSNNMSILNKRGDIYEKDTTSMNGKVYFRTSDIYFEGEALYKSEYENSTQEPKTINIPKGKYNFKDDWLDEFPLIDSTPASDLLKELVYYINSNNTKQEFKNEFSNYNGFKMYENKDKQTFHISIKFDDSLKYLFDEELFETIFNEEIADMENFVYEVVIGFKGNKLNKIDLKYEVKITGNDYSEYTVSIKDRATYYFDFSIPNVPNFLSFEIKDMSEFIE